MAVRGCVSANHLRPFNKLRQVFPFSRTLIDNPPSGPASCVARVTFIATWAQCAARCRQQVPHLDAIIHIEPLRMVISLGTTGCHRRTRAQAPDRSEPVPQRGPRGT